MNTTQSRAVIHMVFIIPNYRNMLKGWRGGDIKFTLHIISIYIFINNISGASLPYFSTPSLIFCVKSVYF